MGDNGFVMSVVDEVKDRIDIVELIGETVKLRKTGKNFSGFCPFHPNKRTPAFVVFPETETWRCFGACNEGGDVFRFLMKKEGWDFPQTLSYLAQRAGIELQPFSPAQKEAKEEHERLSQLLESAVSFYRTQLLNQASGERVLQYLQDRNLSLETLEQFEIGYAPQSWDATHKSLLDRGYSEQEIINAGMVSERDEGGVYDRFRHRVMIPIRQARGQLVGFGARIVNPADVPKFLNSPQGVLFDKSKVLFGLEKAGREIRRANQAVIVEGYFDVIALHQAGFKNAVSPMGTALTTYQLRLLKRYSRNIVLALDPDVAGEQASIRGVAVAMDQGTEPGENVKSLVRSEGRLDAEIRVASLPEGLDPDEVVERDPKVWQELIEDSVPIISHLIEVATLEQALDDPKVKWEIARRVLPVIEEVSNPIEREAYRQTLARKLQVDERAFLSWHPRFAEGRRQAPILEYADPLVDENSARKLSTQDAVERFCLGLLLRDPELIYRIDRQFHALELEPFSSQDFTGTERQVIFQAIRSSLAQHEAEPNEYWRTRLEQNSLVAAESLVASVNELDLSRPKIAEGVLADFLRLRRRNIEFNLRQLHYQQVTLQEAQSKPNDQEALIALAMDVHKVTIQKERIDRALAGKASLSQSPITLEGRR
jgi:DNA primase